ncbi:hypothetical protein VMCG_09816 [Cytospora schulzeri]|uniref:AB hydrolase-1 domain-containing protein n=1 Tax=Cytospora schulzeri TaxID=448051 RepID=A0A423VHW7_9PEZI|nr:hypothetical protein VMCG_09816 [Valsa malicola]
MQPFRLVLPNGATLTGLHNLPETSSPVHTTIRDRSRPLVITIHGGSYCSNYFDADLKHSASLCSNGLGIPVVSIDRPLYQGSSSFYPSEKGKSYHEALALWLHQYILPTLWSEFGKGCGSMVLHCHSLATPSAVILAGWVADQQTKGDESGYPLAGLTISGFGSQNTAQIVEQGKKPSPDPLPEYIDHPVNVKNARMIPEGTADPGIYEQSHRLHNRMPYAEIGDLKAIWADGKWRDLCGRVKVPVMIGLAEIDALWMGTEGHLKEFAGGFAASAKVDASLVKRAPHCIELSYWAQGWYARSFGWALECAATYSVEKGKTKEA